MPVYEYRCTRCGRPSSIFYRSLAVVDADPACPHCGERALQRRMSRVWVHGRSGRDEGPEPAFEADDVPAYGDFDSYDEMDAGDDEDFDPVTFAREAREMARVMGEPLDQEFDQALRHIESGADPEEVFGEMDEAVSHTDEPLGPDTPGDA